MLNLSCMLFHRLLILAGSSPIDLILFASKRPRLVRIVELLAVFVWDNVSTSTALGLVCITPAAGFVTPGWSIAIGALGAPWCFATVELMNKINLVDDTLDAFGLHGSGGFAGALLTGIFALDGGLIYSGSFLLLGKQIAGALAGVAFSAVGTAIIVGVMKLLLKLRIPEEHEVGGVDQHTHGESYHSPVKQYPKAKSSDVSESTEQPSETV